MKGFAASIHLTAEKLLSVRFLSKTSSFIFCKKQVEMEMIQRKDKAEEHARKHCNNNEKEKRRRKNRAQNGAETEDQYDEQTETVTKEKIKKKKKKREEEQNNEAEDQYDEQTVTKDTIKKKKKKRREEEEQKNEAETEDQYDKQTVNKEKIKKKKKKREEGTENLEQSAKKEEEQVNEDEEEEEKTVSIAVAGSIINNAQSFELATRLAGQIARAATIFRIDEVIVFDCKADTGVTSNVSIWEEKNESGALFLARILEYLDMPQYLRRVLIPRHNDLRHAGLLPPLDAPHHARKHEWVLYREGVTLDGQPPAGYGTYVDVGLTKAVFIQQTMKPQIRVTVAMGSNKSLDDDCVRQAVKRSEPKRKLGVYWGYTVRYASNIVDAFKECPYKGGYDYSIGTSEHGDILRSADLVIPNFRHLLIAFGGLKGLEENIEKDVNLKGTNVRQLFNCYLNTCPNQGSRTIRTEEATFISLQYFQDPIQRAKSSARIQ